MPAFSFLDQWLLTVLNRDANVRKILCSSSCRDLKEAKLFFAFFQTITYLSTFLQIYNDGLFFNSHINFILTIKKTKKVLSIQDKFNQKSGFLIFLRSNMNEPFLAERWNEYLDVFGQLKSLGGDVQSEGSTPAGLTWALFNSPYDK